MAATYDAPRLGAVVRAGSSTLIYAIPHQIVHFSLVDAHRRTLGAMSVDLPFNCLFILCDLWIGSTINCKSILLRNQAAAPSQPHISLAPWSSFQSCHARDHC